MLGGRPTAYKPENAEIVRHACVLGATNQTLAERFEVSRCTADNWIATIPEFGDAVRRGHQVADETVISARELEAASERARLASLPAASQALRSSPPPSCFSPPLGGEEKEWADLRVRAPIPERTLPCRLSPSP